MKSYSIIYKYTYSLTKDKKNIEAAVLELYYKENPVGDTDVFL